MSSPAPKGEPPAPRFWFVFDYRIVASALIVGVVAFVSCDVVNAKLNVAVERWMGRERVAPDPTSWTPGAVAEVDITLITRDAERLACADDREFEGLRCEYQDEKRRRPRDPQAPQDDNRARLIQPYRTALGNHLVMIGGLWATPAIAMRRHLEPARGVPEKSQKRFIARCTLRFVGEMNGVDVRWDFNQKWYVEAKAPVAIAQDCRIPRE